jgi:hypothetical protein
MSDPRAALAVLVIVLLVLAAGPLIVRGKAHDEVRELQRVSCHDDEILRAAIIASAPARERALLQRSLRLSICLP